MNPVEISFYIASVRWQTSLDRSHQYTMAKWNPEMSELFCKFVQHIRENGYVETFMGKDYTYFDVGDYKYWSMGAPVDQTILINRTRV